MLLSLTETERRRFQSFLIKAEHSVNPEWLEYLQLMMDRRGRLKKNLPGDKVLIEQKLISRFKAKKDLYKCRNRLIALLESFLASDSFPEEELQKHIRLAGIYREKNLRVRYDRSMRKIEQLVRMQKIQNSTLLLNRYQWQLLNFEGTEQEFRRKDDRRIEQLAHALDHFYLTEKMRLSIEMLNRSQLLQTAYHQIIHPDSLSVEVRKEHPDILNIYIYCYQLILSPQDENLYTLYDNLLQKLESRLEKDTKGSLYLYAINFCVKNINLDKTIYYDRLLSLISRMESNGILLHKGFINPWVFKNAVQSYLKKNQSEEARIFLEKYRDRLPETHRESVAVLSQAQIAFAQKEYEEIFYLTNQLSYLDQHLVVGLKLLSCKARLQLDHRVRLESELESFSKYLRYHATQLGAERVARIDQFIRFCRRLNHIQPGDKQALTRLQERLGKGAPMAESEWMHEYLARKIRRPSQRRI